MARTQATEAPTVDTQIGAGRTTPIIRRPKPADALDLAQTTFLAGERVEMAMVAVGLDISQATIYRWFGTRERLIEQVLDRIVKAATLETFRSRCRPEQLAPMVAAFEGEGLIVHTGADVASPEYAKLLPKLPGLRDTLSDLEVGETPAAVASALEFVLEGLHLSKRLNKDSVGDRATYRGRG